MTIRINNLDKWESLEPGKGLHWKEGGVRKIRLRLNCPAPTRVDIVQDDSKPVFLAVVHGLETLDFTIDGSAEVVFTTDDEVWFHTHEGDETAFDVPEAVSFTKIAQRRSRNPQLEMMMFRAEQNMMRRLQKTAADFEAKLVSAGVRHDTTTGEIADDEVSSNNGDGATAKDAGTAEVSAGSAAPVEKPASDT